MTQKHQVIVYGASGYTGRLVAEHLRDQQIPFIAAGRNKEKVEEAMKLVPGIESATYDVVQVEHTVESLTELFSGSKVVCNTVGPFDLLGETTVEACVNAGVHYLDTTGEQRAVRRVRDKYGDKFAEKGLVAAPSTAYMHTVCEIAGEICKQYSDIDSLDFTCYPIGVPTEASTQTIWHMLSAEQYYVEHGELKLWPPAKAYDMVIPTQSVTVPGLPWTGSALPIWYQHDAKIRTIKSYTGFSDREMMERLIALWQHYETNIKQLPKEEQKKALSELASQFTPGMPPRENPLVHRCYDRCIGTGGLNQVTVSIYSTRAYQQTGLIQAVAAKQLIGGYKRGVGFQSACSAFGHDVFLSALEGGGFSRVVVEEI